MARGEKSSSVLFTRCRVVGSYFAQLEPDLRKKCTRIKEKGRSQLLTHT